MIDYSRIRKPKRYSLLINGLIHETADLRQALFSGIHIDKIGQF